MGRVQTGLKQAAVLTRARAPRLYEMLVGISRLRWLFLRLTGSPVLSLIAMGRGGGSRTGDERQAGPSALGNADTYATLMTEIGRWKQGRRLDE